MTDTHRHVAKRTTDWVELGTISTNVAMFAIVAPSMAGALNGAWSDYLGGKLLERAADSIPTFDQWKLQDQLFNCHGEQHNYQERALLFCTPDNGGYVVEGRFGPHYVEEGQEHDPDVPVHLVELRIRLADTDDCADDPEDCGWAGDGP